MLANNNHPESALNNRRFIRSGALGGAASALVFAGIHAILISDIWFSTIPMMVAGAACGLCVAWTYGLLFVSPSVASWVTYNTFYLAMFLLLGAASVAFLDPVTTIAAVIAANEPPTHLFAEAMPLTLFFLVAVSALLGVLFARNWRHYTAILITCTVLVTLLGLNVSVIGLVSVPSSSLYLVLELFGLIVVLNAIYAAVFVALEWPRLRRDTWSLDAA